MDKKIFEYAKEGKIEIKSKYKVKKDNLFWIYTPGVAEVVKAVSAEHKKADELTWRGNTVAIVTDGSAILGLGNHGAEAALPVMEAKAVLFKELGGVNAVPIVLKTQNPKKIIEIVENIAPGFGGINLEDIAAPNCFVVEETLKRKLSIPVFHDDQHGTAVVILAGLINAAEVTGKNLKNAKIVISGAGAAAIATAKLLLKFGVKNIILFDSKGPIYKGKKGLNKFKKQIAEKTNLDKFEGSLPKALESTDIFVGLSQGGLLKASDVQKMAPNSIVFALANPTPEIMPDEAKKGGAGVVATGRSDFPNQINNSLVFPGIFKGVLATKTKNINDDIKIAAAKAIASIVKKPVAARIIPDALDKKVVQAVAEIFK